jgi:hypothetical protein
MIFVWKTDKNFEINKDLLKLQPLTTDTKGSVVSQAINKVVSEFISFEKFTGIVTYGAKLMVGSKTGLGGHLKQLGVNCVLLHCIIHQGALCGKIIKMNETMKVVVNILNLIRRGKKSSKTQGIHYIF